MFVWQARSFRVFLAVALWFTVFAVVQNSFMKPEACGKKSGCDCNPGFWGKYCQFSRLRLTDDSGVITDGSGKYRESSKFTWLIESTRPNSTIELEFDQFATECSWDHFYVYDGRSIRAPLVGALSGLLRDTSVKSVASNPVVYLHTKSGAAFLYFYSDANFAMNGFSIKYRVKPDCSAKCSYHGDCDAHGACLCKPGWAGASCDRPTCPMKCVSGTCDVTARHCRGCASGFTGPTCNTTLGKGFWIQVLANNEDSIEGRASHAVVVIGDWLWVYGGYSLNQKPFNDIIRYNIHNNTWEDVVPHPSSPVPQRRYGHSMVAVNGTLIVFGGRVDGSEVNELWSFNTHSKIWSEVVLAGDSDTPIAVSGHSATLVGNKMIVIFGYSPEHGFTQNIQEYDLESNTWLLLNVSTSIAWATYGHSSVYEPVSGGIYVHGGYRGPAASGPSKDEISSDLNVYIPSTREWMSLISSGYPRYLHSAVLIGNMMLVYGGNTHNTTANTEKLTKCFSSDFLLYDLRCSNWIKMPKHDFPLQSARFGHVAIPVNSSMIVIGGFNGTMLNDMLLYNIGDCSAWKDSATCQQAYTHSGCAQLLASGACISSTEARGQLQNAVSSPVCPANPHRCKGFRTCERCTSSQYGCKWCEEANKCSDTTCHPTKNAISSADKCGVTPRLCQGSLCTHSRCDNKTTCDSCTLSKDCMWCEVQRKCIALNAYVVSFPYGQCHEWTRDKCSAVQCSAMKTCLECHSLPGCGWCDDGSGTGLGKCLPGGDEGPFAATSNSSTPVNQCLPKHGQNMWYFIECPACQCNGHSTCDVNDKCKACQHNTDGTHCDVCSSGYHGNPKNGGRCKECKCNKHGSTCDQLTGVCRCLTKGVTGPTCEMCEKTKGYHGNATNGGDCYFDLTSNYVFTFNVTGHNRVSFRNYPEKTDRDVKFKITIRGSSATMNVTYKPESSSGEVAVINALTVGYFEAMFKQEDHTFGRGFAFLVYVYDIKSSVLLEISFSQTPPFLLLKFFLTFFGCFFSILVVTFIAWKIKVRYNSYLMSRQRQVEMRQMASRPSSVINLLIDKHDDPYSRHTYPTAIAQQPYALGNVGVVTVLVRLPSTAAGFAPIGQSGVCCASALVSTQGLSSCAGGGGVSNVRRKAGRRNTANARRSRLAPCI